MGFELPGDAAISVPEVLVPRPIAAPPANTAKAAATASQRRGERRETEGDT